jgi:two-component system chemotaxis response regulator CheY
MVSSAAARVALGTLESYRCTHRRNGASRAAQTPMMGITTTHGTIANWHQVDRLYNTRVMRPRVLVVDDDPDTRVLMAQLLRAAGFKIDVATNGQDALDRAHENPPRVIVLDMVMPVMDGWEFRAHQRDSATLATIPVVVLSGVSPARLRIVGAAATLQKPFDSHQLIAAVRAHC